MGISFSDNKVYDNDEILVPKNTSVIVSRVPIQGGTKNKNSDKPDLPLPIDEDDFGLIRYDRIVKNADLVNANSTEEDKVKAMITQSSQEYDPSKYVKSRSMTGPLPPSYTCFRCGKQGHWIKNCPTNNPDVKRSTGIPRSFMVPVDGPEHKGALLTSSGDYAVPLIDHQAYKEVKKEKPPFVPQDEPVVEPEPQVPEELLCMVCNDLLQDAVLIPCCGNSFCDECVRQVLLESDNHECPICHETQVSPNTLIPNRFLRTAVANYKNEKGKVSSSLVRKAAPPPPPPVPQPASPVPRRVDSPQPSPDSTVESQSNATDASAAQHDKSPKRTEPKKIETKDAPLAPLQKIKSGNSTPTVCHTPENATPKRSAETDSEDAQPGTPLADEPPIDVINPHHLPIQTIGHEHYSHHHDRYEHSGRYSRSRRDDYGRHYNRSSENQEQSAISTIETITNMRNKCKFSRPAPPRGQFLNQRSHRDDRLDYDHEEYHGRYEKKHERSSRRNHYDRSDRESRYTSSSHEYQSSEHEHSDSHYDVHQHEESSSRRHVERYRSPPRALLVTPSVPPSAIYTAPVPAVPPIHPPIILPPAPQVFAPQPPPPGASPINTAQIPSQPPPPGVGPPLLPLSSEAPPAFGSRPFDKEAPLKDSQKAERSIDDRMEEFQRKLEKRDRDEYSRDRSPRSRSRSSDRHRSRSSSWSRSGTRSSTRTSRSRSRTPFSSRSRTRSFSPSRSRSWSKKRSYSRSRSRTRTKSRSRSRSRNDSRARRRGGSRDSRQWSPRTRGRSHSFSPKSYRHSSRRNEPYSLKHPYNPPQYPAVSSYQSQYGPPPPPIIPMTVMRPPAFPPHHMHSLHPPPIQPIHSRSMEPYPPVERSMKYPPSYGGQYPVYDVYSQKYQQPKYDREQRFGDHRGGRYDRRSEYPRNEEEVHHRIPGWVGDRSRDYKPRYRQSRDIRGKEIRELPHIPEEDVKADVKESSVEASSKKKEEKVSSKHKKHHHHHKSKDSKKQDGKSSRASAEEASDSSKNLVKGEGGLEKEEKKVLSESDSKILDKAKDKKHKHKKHKTGDQPIKKKRSSKKEKLESVPVADGEAPPTKVKVKKKKLKAKTEESVKDVEEKVSTPVASLEEKVEDSLPAPEEVPEEETAAKPSQDSDVLDIFAEDPEPEAAGTKAETVQEAPVEENTEVANNVEMMEAEKIEETINSEEETEEIIEDENVLRVDVPGISKWEREESEDEESTVPQRRSSVVVSTEETGPISSDIISRAENVLLSKQFKPRIESRDDKNSRDSSEATSRDSTPVKRKEAVELKSVVNSEQLHSDTLQVIVSNKDKRAVYSRKEEGKSSKSEIQVPKRSRPEKSSHRYYEEPRRSVATYPSREERIRDYRDKGSDRRDLKYSPTRKGRMDERLREHKEYIRRPLERDVEMREDSLRREDRKRRFESARGGDQSSSHDRKKDHYESRRRQELQKYVDKGPKSESYKKFRAGSMESSRDSFDSYGKRGEKRVEERHKHRNEKGQGDSQESARRKHSPIKAPGTAADHSKPLKREYHDELKFEPDYDEFSDIEEKIHDVKEKHKKRADSSPEIKRAKVEKPSRSEMKPHKPEKSNVSSSSSAVSESDSSDSDEPKGKSKSSDTDHKQKHKKSKHKKHKKHKHKHKKKKSHKSKRD